MRNNQMGELRLNDYGFVGIALGEVQKYLRIAPVMMVLFLNDEFLEYGGDVDSLIGCREERKCSFIVGSGCEDSKEYCLIRNSFGISWGEAGYYKLSSSVYTLKLDGYSTIQRYLDRGNPIIWVDLSSEAHT